MNHAQAWRRFTILFVVVTATALPARSVRASGDPVDNNAAAATANDREPPFEANSARGGGLSRLYDIPLHTLDGRPTSLRSHTRQALLIVNVASRCGLTPQYAVLEKLHRRYADRGFSVLGFPCNQFGGQEPGDAAEIRRFCRVEYDVTFPLFEKIEVNGTGRHPLYRILVQVPDSSGYAGDIRWNFEKFVVAAGGQNIFRFAPTTAPDDPAIIAAIESALPPR